jgi:hypothetical protein
MHIDAFLIIAIAIISLISAIAVTKELYPNDDKKSFILYITVTILFSCSIFIILLTAFILLSQIAYGS